jgi:iron complex transport system substrate-binding protein
MKIKFKLLSLLIVTVALSAGVIGYAKSYHRIVSLSPVITESLYLLGLGKDIIANTQYCNRPEEAKRKKKIGTLLDVNVEKIAGLKPDLVLASALTPKADLKRLNLLGIAFVCFEEDKSFSQLCDQFVELGIVVGRGRRAMSIAKDAKKQVSQLRRDHSDYQPKVFVQIGAKPLFTVTKDSFINDLIEFAGGVNIAVNSKQGIYSRETVIRQNPDIIIIVTMGANAQEQKEVWQKYEIINAVKNDKVYILNPYMVCSPTPLGFVEVLKEFMQIINPT